MTIIWIASAYIPSWGRPGRWKIADWGLGIGPAAEREKQATRG